VSTENELLKGINLLDCPNLGRPKMAELVNRLNMNRGGFDEMLFRRVASSLKATKADFTRFKAIDLIEAYENHLGRSESTKCGKCHSSGFVKVILLDTQVRGWEKTFIYNWRDPKPHNNFIKNQKRNNIYFKARQAILPCTCENGTNKNTKNEQVWLSDEIRQRAFARAVSFQDDNSDETTAHEDYYQDQYCIKINKYNQGVGYEIKAIQDHPTIEEMKRNLTKELAGV
jgi:hypothetical protein